MNPFVMFYGVILADIRLVHKAKAHRSGLFKNHGFVV